MYNKVIIPFTVYHRVTIPKLQLRHCWLTPITIGLDTKIKKVLYLILGREVRKHFANIFLNDAQCTQMYITFDRKSSKILQIFLYLDQGTFADNLF